jgi:cobalamin-dependent methionine synthase I
MMNAPQSDATPADATPADATPADATPPVLLGGAALTRAYVEQDLAEMQLVPEQPTDALVVHHPEAKYFST